MTPLLPPCAIPHRVLLTWAPSTITRPCFSVFTWTLRPAAGRRRIGTGAYALLISNSARGTTLAPKSKHTPPSIYCKRKSFSHYLERVLYSIASVDSKGFYVKEASCTCNEEKHSYQGKHGHHSILFLCFLRCIAPHRVMEEDWYSCACALAVHAVHK